MGTAIGSGGGTCGDDRHDRSQPARASTAAPASVVMVATTLPARPGDGTPEFVLTLARSIPDHDVTVIAPRLPGAARDEVIDGVRVRRVAYFPRRWEGLATDAIMPTLRAEKWRVVEAPFLFGALLLATWREVRGRRSVVINAHWIVPAGLVAMVVSFFTRAPYVVTVHGSDAYTLCGAQWRRVKQRVMRHAAAVLPVSEDIARMLDVTGAPVLRMGVDTAAIRTGVGARVPEAGLLVFIGRLADNKGVDVLIEAVSRLDGARLDVIGDGSERAALRQQAERVGVAGRVRFLGKLPKSQVLAALARAHLVVIPSRMGADGAKEGTPVVLCEAMAAGVPVVASDLGGLGECIHDGVDGVLVPPDDVDALTTVLHKALSGSLDVAALGRAAAHTAEGTLDISAVGGAYAQVLEDAATRRRLRR